MFSASKSGQYQGYLISRSVRLRSSASAYFTRTPGSATNRQTWTWSGWVKRGSLGVVSAIMGAQANGSQSTQRFTLLFLSDNTLYINDGQINVSDNLALQTTQVFRDPSAWYHIVLAMDTTQATASNRVKLYINGTQVTAFVSASYPTQNFNTAVNNNVAQYLNYYNNLGTISYFDGYLTEINFIDGQALTPSSFGVTNAYGVWTPIKYNGTYGTNGFYLNFSDNSGATATTIGKDSSGNGNNWTPNNISVTAGTTYDSMLDVPTPWGDGGNGRGNYCVLNPLDKDTNITFSDGNLKSTGYNAGGATSFGLTSDKWYWEVTLIDPYASGNWGLHGVSSGKSNSYIAGYTGSPTGAGVYILTSAGGGTWASGSAVTASTTWANGDIIGFAFDATNLTMDVYRNNTKIGTTLTVPSGAIYPTAYQNGTSGDTSSTAYNFGQRPFSYTPPSGFRALNTFNLPEPSIDNGALYMTASLYTGTGANLTVTNTTQGVTFQPDFVWVKGRSGATDHALYDAVRGTQNDLVSNSTAAATTQSTGLTAFNSNGFTVGTLAKLNTNTATYVAWQWNAGGSNATNTSGSITSTVRASTTSGFSVVTYTGTGANATVGHGLGVAPSMVIVKRRDSTGNWQVRHTSIAAANSIQLNLTSAAAAAATVWNSTAPTSTVFSIGTSTDVNANTGTYVAYCFASITGYSAFGSYTGNGSADGPFIFTGFRPAFVMIKSSSSAGGNWLIQNNKTLGYNPSNSELYANLSNAETTADRTDLLSNGFKPRINSAENNSSGVTYIYAAFAENPFKYSLAR